jgi:hypothetical protein
MHPAATATRALLIAAVTVSPIAIIANAATASHTAGRTLTSNMTGTNACPAQFHLSANST